MTTHFGTALRLAARVVAIQTLNEGSALHLRAIHLNLYHLGHDLTTRNANVSDRRFFRLSRDACSELPFFELEGGDWVDGIPEWP